MYFKKSFKKKRFIKSKRFYKSKRIKAKKIFERKLNSIAEKKMVVIENSAPCYPATSSTQLTAILNTSFVLAQGVSDATRIGSKIFCRYFIFKLALTNYETTSGVFGKIGIVLLHERQFASAQTITVSDLFTGSGRMETLNYGFLKNNFDKIKMWTREILPYNSSATGYAKNTIFFQKKLKIMRNWKYSDDGNIIEPRWIIFMVYFGTGQSTVLVTAPPVRYQVTYSFTDV